MTLEDINKIIQEQFKLDPIEFKEPTAVNEEMKQALAEAWAKPGFRMYLDNSINILIKNSAVHSATLEDMAARKGGIVFLTQFKARCADCFHNFNKKQLK